ncbi:DUF222 domain-containing protein [Barrientosiimonas humi]|uniref:DUF222 domain-containing protein n=1 Tax=Barrientosiimonas humi TaxID=999931 RepID=UPI00370D47A7
MTATTTVEPATGGVVPERLTVSGALAQLHATLDALGDQPDATVVAEADAVGRAVSEVERLSRRVASLRLRLVACANRSQVARRSGFSTTGAWLASRTNTSGGAATREADLAETLESVLPVTGQAMAEGRVSPEHAAVIAWAIQQLPEVLTAEQVARVEASLVGDAARMSPARLRGAARRALAVVEPDQQAVDEHEDQVLRGEEASALGRCRLSMHDNSDGTVSGSFVLPRLAGDILRKAVQQLAAPRRGTPAPPRPRPPARQPRPWTAALGGGRGWGWTGRTGTAWRWWSCWSTCRPTGCPARSPRPWW